MKWVSQAQEEMEVEVEVEVGYGGHLFLGRVGLGNGLLVVAAAFFFRMKVALEQLRESVSRLPLDRTIDLDSRHPSWQNPPPTVHRTVARSSQAIHQNYGRVGS